MGFNNSTYSRTRIGSTPPTPSLDTADLKRLPFRPYVPAPSVIVHRVEAEFWRSVPSLMDKSRSER